MLQPFVLSYTSIILCVHNQQCINDFRVFLFPSCVIALNFFHCMMCNFVNVLLPLLSMIPKYDLLIALWNMSYIVFDVVTLEKQYKETMIPTYVLHFEFVHIDYKFSCDYWRYLDSTHSNYDLLFLRQLDCYQLRKVSNWQFELFVNLDIL